MTTFIQFLIVFVILVLVHEFGHYIVAKRSGILVREFSIGMGPKLVAFRKNKTTYTLRLLPLGGYVRMAGWQDDEDEIKPGTMIAIETNDAGKVQRINLSSKTTLQGGIPVQVDHADLVNALEIVGYANGDESELKTWQVDHDATIIEEDGVEVVIAPADVQFQNASVWRRLAVNFAGPLNNFILAILVFIGIGWVNGVVEPNTNQIGAIVADSAAQKSGIKDNAEIISVDGKKIASFDEIGQHVSKKKNQTVQLVVRQDGKTQNMTVKVSKDGTIGVYPHTVKSFGAAVSYGFQQSWSTTTRIVSVLKELVTGQFSLNKLAGPVGIYTMTASAAQGGWITLAFFLAMLSLNLGIMNLIPIPVLDGGKILLNLIEVVRGKPISREKEGLVTMIGAAVMFALVIAVTINDILRQF